MICAGRKSQKAIPPSLWGATIVDGRGEKLIGKSGENYPLCSFFFGNIFCDSGMVS